MERVRAQVHGHVAPGFDSVAGLFGKLFAVPGRGGGAFTLRRGDEVLVDIWGGIADPATGREWAHNTLGLSFSTSKGIAAAVIHRLADHGLLGYDEPVASLWPEFAAGGKERITVRQLLSHRAGLDRLAPIAPDRAALLNHVGAEERLAARKPDHAPGAPAYHAITYGWLLAGLARAITGLGMEELVISEISEPLGLDGLHFGTPAVGAERMAPGLGTLGPLIALAPAAMLLPGFVPTRRAVGALWAPGMAEVFAGPEPAVWATVMPAANGMFSAASLATLYAALANDGLSNGRQFLSSRTVRELSRVQTFAPDRVFGFPALWRLGYHQAAIPRTWLPRAFGQYGYAGSGGWADPETGLSAAFVSNRIFPVTSPFGDLAFVRLSRLAVAAARRDRTPAVQAAAEAGAPSARAASA
jgi:CubicO group peptidase (beta-lactamase class C family)